MKTKIEIRVSKETSKQLSHFVGKYNGETESSLISKAMSRFVTVARVDKTQLENVPGLDSGKEKARSKVNPLLLSSFRDQVKQLGYKDESKALRVALEFYIATEPYTPIVLDLENVPGGVIMKKDED